MKMDKAKITGLVAAILNSRELVINVGELSGVSIGMKFRVLDQEKMVRDPETGEILGAIRREKIRVKVVDVQEKLSVARTYETYKTGSLGYSTSLLRAAIQPPVTKVRTLKYEDAGVDYEPLPEDSSFVKVGDPVELIIDEG